MIFQTELTNLDAELSQLQAALDTKRQQRQQFEELDAETNAALELVAQLTGLKRKSRVNKGIIPVWHKFHVKD